MSASAANWPAIRARGAEFPEFPEAIKGETGPRQVAERLTARVAELQEELKRVSSANQAKRIQRQIKMSRNVIRWCKTRAGY